MATNGPKMSGHLSPQFVRNAVLACRKGPSLSGRLKTTLGALKMQHQHMLNIDEVAIPRCLIS